MEEDYDDDDDIFYILHSCIMKKLLQYKPTNAHNSLELQQCSASNPTCFGPHHPLIKECTVAQKNRLTF